jgi:choice-of-anchor B domain-containing protein
MRYLFYFFTLLMPLAAFAQESLNMEMVYHWDEGGTIASSAWGNIYNEVWGYAQDGREYAIIGTTEGTHFLDITDATEPVEVDFVAGAAQGPVIVHRDYHNLDNYLYMVCQEGQSTLQIADLSYLPDSVHVVYDSDEILVGSHNIFIDTTQAVLYAVFNFINGTNNIVRWQRIDISDPVNPSLIDQTTSGPYIHDLYVDDGIAFMNRGNTDMAVYDFNQDPPAILGTIDGYIGQGYNHSGYPTPDLNTYVMGDETHGSPIKILDISDLTDIEVLSTVTSGVNDLSIAHNQIVYQNRMYSAYYYDGIYAWSIEDPENPVLLGYYDTSELEHQQSYEGAWGVYPFLPSGNILVSDMQTGLWIFQLDPILSAENTDRENVVNIWPNPVSETLNIHSSAYIHSFSIRDLGGKEVVSGKTGLSNTIDVGALDKGIYILQLESDKGLLNKKFIVK